MKKTAALLFGLLVLNAERSFGIDETGAESKQAEELSEVQQQIGLTDAEIKRLEVQKRHALEQLKKLEKHYGDTINTVLNLKTDIDRQQQLLQAIRNDINATEKSIDTAKQGLEGLIKSAYAMGDKERLKVILNQQDPVISSRMMVYYDYINQERLNKLENIEKGFDNLRQLEANKLREGQLLQVALDKKNQEMQNVAALKLAREKLVSRLEKQYAVKVEQLEELLISEKKLQDLVASLQKSSEQATLTATNTPDFSDKPFEQLQGRLPWPVAGIITNKFGSERFDTSWDGVVIDAKEGANIHAVSGGQVVYADWLRGYGLMLIIDHGQGYMTLYAFNQSLHKNVGDTIKAGDVIASAGKSGGRSQAALYFGIRKQSRAVDPELWCRKTGK